jgi:hypothetical protein
VPAAHFSSRKERRSSRFATKIASINPAAAVDPDIPDFAGLLRQFYKKTHPDLLRAAQPVYADVNDISWQTLNGILSTIKESNSYPPRMIQDIPFYLRAPPPDQGTFICAQLQIRTDGGDCRKKFTLTLQQFFVASGISADGRFHWGAEYFPLPTGSQAPGASQPGQ